MIGHSHRETESESEWQSDIAVVYFNRYPALLEANHRLAFLWQQPIICFKLASHPRTKKWDTLTRLDAILRSKDSSMKRNCVLLRVGVDAGAGRIQGPLFKDGTFEFICIPDKKGVSVHTYGSMIGRYGRPFVDYFPSSSRVRMAAKHIHVDPEFDTFTYGDPTPPKKSLRGLKPGDILAFYCGLQDWDEERGWSCDTRPALYLAGYFEVALAGMATEFDDDTLRSQFGSNFHVRYPSVFTRQRDDLVLVKGDLGSRLFNRAHKISTDGLDRSGNRLKVLSPEMQEIFGGFGGHISIQRSPPRWVAGAYVDRAIGYIRGLE